MNHLETATGFISEPGSCLEPEIYNQAAIAHALIAIAEQLERANDLEEGMDYSWIQTQSKWKEDK